MIRLLHTADWQIGKPFQSMQDHAKREALRQQRLDTVRSLKAIIDSEQIDCVVVCGDLFDSATPDAATVSGLCSAVGSLKVPVYAIPGNHDHGGPGCIWQQEFFVREQAQLASNFQVFLESEPVILDKAILLPCPLLLRHEGTDPTAWLRDIPEGLAASLPRIVLAHGSTQGFSSSGDNDQDSAINRINLSQFPNGAYDYVALGDWHGVKEITANAWFSGTVEQDRFAKGESNQPGHVCVVQIDDHGSSPKVTPIKTGQIGWHSPEVFQLTSDADLDPLESQLNTLVGGRTNSDLLQLRVHGTLSFTGIERFEQIIESLRARLIRLDLEEELQIEPSDEELNALTERQDPLIAQVAGELRDQFESDPLAREALRELHLQVMKVQG